jgi:protein O-mannosyl-transferase
MRSDTSKIITASNKKPHWPKDLANISIRPKAIATIIACLVITAATALVYSNTLQSPFTFDDLSNIPENPYIRFQEISAENIFNLINISGNRPVPALSFALNYYIGGYNPFGYHIGNMIIHAITGMLLFFFIKSTAGLYDKRNEGQGTLFSLPITIISFFTALLWIVHPVNTQSVTYIIQRMNSLSTMFCMLCFVLYIQARSSSGRKKSLAFIAALFFWALALGSKENAAILPILILLYEWYFFQNLSKEWLTKHSKYFMAALVFFGVLAFVFLGTNPIEKLKTLRDFSEGNFTYTERVLTQFRVIVYYINLFFYPNPSRLNLDYDFPLSYSLINPATTLFSAVTLFGFIIIGILTAKNSRMLSFCIFWFFITLAIESSVIPLAIIFEHRTYMPFMGLSLLSVLLIDRYAKLNLLKILLLCILISIGSMWTFQRNEIWKDQLTLWQDCVRKSPKKARPHLCLGQAYAEIKDHQLAFKHYEQALKINPNYSEVRNNMGNLLAKEGRLEEAEVEYRLSLQIRPGYYKAHNNLATILIRQKKYGEARQHFIKSIILKPGFALGYANLGKLSDDLAETTKALDYYYKAIELSPGLPIAHNNIGKHFAKSGNFPKAEFHFNEALKSDPSNSEAMANIGIILQEHKKIPEAMTYYKKALTSDSENTTAHFNMANLYMVTGDKENAEKHYRETLRLDDEHVGAHTNLGSLLSEKGDTATALEHYMKAIELDPEYADAHNNIGNILSAEQAFKSAIPYYHKAIRLDPDSDDAYANLGIALLRVGDVEGAREAFRIALQTNPSNQSAQNGLEIIQSSAGTPPTIASPEELHQKALEHATRGEYDLAVELFKKILDLVPSEPGTCYNIACMYAKMGNIPESIEWLTQAIQNGYDNWDAIKSDPDLANIREADAFKALIKDR